MSRFKRFAHSLVSGYLLLGANVVYTLLSIPLALHYLSLKEFGLWSLTSQIAGYLTMIDLGMNTSVSRILIDKKDSRADGSYGAAIKTGALVGVSQGSIVCLVGLGLLGVLPHWLRVDPELSTEFFWLMLGQVLLTSIAFPARIFGQVLYAWQRMDISNYSQIAQMFVWMVARGGGFAAGLGIYSLLLSLVAGSICSTFICAIACRRLGLWPKRGEWGATSRQQFHELFSYGADVFLIAIGTQLIMSSQVILVTRLLGLEAAGTWNVMTKVFTLQLQILLRFIANTMPAFAEMMARHELTRLRTNYRSLFISVSVLSGLCAILLAAGNSLFVSIWTHGKIHWATQNDFLLALWLLLLTQQCCHNSFIACLKEIRELKYTYLIEGAAFIGAAYWILPRAGFTGMLTTSIVCLVTFTWANGTFRVARLAAHQEGQSLWLWMLPLVRLLLMLVPIWLVADWFLRDLPDLIHFIVICGLIGVLGLVIALRFALPRELALELAARLPLPLKRTCLLLIQ